MTPRVISVNLFLPPNRVVMSWPSLAEGQIPFRAKFPFPVPVDMICAPKVGHKDKEMQYSPTTAIELSQSILNGKTTIKDVCRKIKVDRKELQIWVELYKNYGDYVFLNEIEYSWEERFKIVEDMVKNALSLREICVKYKIVHRFALRSWYKSYNAGLEVREKKINGNRKVNERNRSQEERIKELEQELRFAKAENAYLKKLQALMQETKKN